ncbi:hypothetical protein LTR53_001788 [Teratosphaeriaceae sp. CCFEE 6253]|nr:hypothetical protein LTR53_001788 [Teratosphaeriaceae sp. CCFEE 6253]
MDASASGSILDEPLSPPSANGTTRHQCYLCSRTYERGDHLSRHLKSHQNERTYRCPDCGKGFNRADLLNRHHAAHSKTDGEALRRRTGRACAQCIKAKTRCDEQRPCKRCKTRQVACEESEARIQSASQPIARRTSSYEEGVSSILQPGSSAQSLEPSLPDPIHAQQLPNVKETELAPAAALQQPTPSPSSRHFEDASLLLGLNSNSAPAPVMGRFDATDGAYQPPGFNPAEMGFPDFFEQIMMPGVGMPQHASVMPPDVSNFTSDLTFDTGDFDFSFLASGLTRPSSAQEHRPDVGSSTAEVAQTGHSDVHLRSEAFRRAPWSWNHWIPERNSHTFAGQETIDVRQDRVDASDQLTSPDSVRLVHCNLGNPERDRMIRVVTQVAQKKLAMPSFPSLELLEDLIDIFLLQDSSAIDSYVHSASFNCEEVRTELLLAIVAAGARYIALDPVWKMGLVIQEVVRLAIGDLYESDNTATRELGPLQALLLVLDIGVWSGARSAKDGDCDFILVRKSMGAKFGSCMRHLLTLTRQPPVTMLAWSNSFRKFSYSDFVPLADDPDDLLEHKWRAWAEREAKKRLILHTFLHDSQVAMLYTTSNPLLSPAQMMMPLPACRELWLAPNAYAWRHAYHRLAPPSQAETPSMKEFFGHNALIERHGSVVDKNLCMLMACHGLGHEVWAYRSHARLLCGWRNIGRRDRSLDHQRLQRDLQDDLTTLYAHCEQQTSASPVVMLTLELLMMLLHVDIEDIQNFSGKLGEEEARTAFPKVSAWIQHGESRTAVYHAGQVFRVARCFEKTRLRDFHAVAVYHAALTLWVYGMVTSNAARKSGGQSPNQTPRMSSGALHGTVGATSSQSVHLDTTDERPARAFQLLGQGTPGISNLDAEFVPLSNSNALMSTAATILKSNFPQSRNGLPPLVANLANLMDELGGLSGRT